MSPTASTTAAATTATATTRTLPTLRIPSKSRSDVIALYPTSPLKVFPPPAPSIRRPLRERCGVSLTLHIETPALTSTCKPAKVPGPWSPKGHIQPHRNHLPRRRNPKPCFAGFQEKHAPAAAAPTTEQRPKPAPALASVPGPVPEPATSYTFDPPKAEEPRLQAIIPALWVAFARRDDRSYEAGFSHVVEICYASPTSPAHDSGTCERLWDGRAQRLRLALPVSARTQSGRAALALSDAQLRAARDFVAECLPKSVAALPEQTAVRVLVTVPQARPTEAMCLVGCYLAFVAGQSAEAILRCIDEEESILSVWKGEVSGDEMERIERIARSWSWLSTLTQR
ncbi:hypothetical protein BD414DRAFT_510615 [Trametes punicea]|nr:hypothetical protein BD414DRAFT_510615 [Trametes punicea]